MKKKILVGLMSLSLASCFYYNCGDCVTFQQKHSLDWDNKDSISLMKIGEYYGGDRYKQAYNMLVALNQSWNKNISIQTISADYDLDYIFYSGESVEGLKLIYKGYDPTFGSLKYKE